MAGRVLLTVLVGFAAVLSGLYRLSIKPKLEFFGEGRVVQPVGNTKCKSYPEAQACEKIVVHHPTGHVYMACSTFQSRPHWLPGTNRLNATGKSSSDYVAVFDPSTSKITRLRAEMYKYPRGLSLHGMDVVSSKQHPSELFIYLVNHREPFAPADANEVGADSVIEVFSTTPGSDEMRFVATWKDPVIATPNDIVATGDDMSFYFTNDHGSIKTGLARRLNIDAFLGLGWSNVAYCHATDGCKVAADNLIGANGITRGKDGTYYVASSKSGRIYVLEQQADNKLVLTDEIPVDRPVDNLSVDQTGAVWGAGLVNTLHLVNVHFENPSIKSPSSALRITLNEGDSSYFGEKYKVEKVFEDDGEIASGSTSVAYDAKRKKLYLHGLAAPHLTVCDI
ncbi:calcium-dependent phosphotriesterase [Fomitiporia mediterranea MF3/22]|uniref:calcium-dependent phosphotriesterase n=1 Tax=Fomitiporia mediterranea (strain MF3/22) TaxID=694068 RepID=UPI0004407BE8|nr:calcium-dependent phosphotriesterase [Fomitiporia mediterranea MF3/22]EJD03191.1 calcium-dependent phosphotriesterase [Fomitiporia mediterranea MF3/22]